MKKLLCTLLALSMLLGLAACGGPAPAEGDVYKRQLLRRDCPALW